VLRVPGVIVVRHLRSRRCREPGKPRTNGTCQNSLTLTDTHDTYRTGLHNISSTCYRSSATAQLQILQSPSSATLSSVDKQDRRTSCSMSFRAIGWNNVLALQYAATVFSRSTLAAALNSGLQNFIRPWMIPVSLPITQSSTGCTNSFATWDAGSLSATR
jgi:hypothetical protein